MSSRPRHPNPDALRRKFKKVDIPVLAANLGVTVNYVYQLMGGHTLAGARRAIELEKLTKGVVTRRDLRPDIFGD